MEDFQEFQAVREEMVGYLARSGGSKWVSQAVKDEDTRVMREHYEKMSFTELFEEFKSQMYSDGQDSMLGSY